jgi:hypothetical protein
MRSLAIAIVLTGLPSLSAQYNKELSSRPRPPRAGGTGPGSYYGTVTDLTKDSITITFRQETPVWFRVSDTLASGGYATVTKPIPGWQTRAVSPSYMFRLKDVKIGDMVDIYYSAIDGVITCDHICITKRPGGRMPALPKEAEDMRRLPPSRAGVKLPPHITYHEYWDAYWALEEKGIPFPEKFGDKRRWPIAPMPRVVGLNGPLISP